MAFEFPTAPPGSGNGEGSGTPSGATPPGEEGFIAPPMQQRTELPFPGVGPSRYFDQITLPQYLQRALVLINGMEYFEWESVEVCAEIGGSPPLTFRLTTSEQEPWPADWAFLRIRPDDKCTVFLDGFLAISGKVYTRQVHYDARQHAIEIQGGDRTAELSRTTADTKSGEWRKTNWMDTLDEIAGSSGISVQTLGQLSKFKIDRFSPQPGQSKREAIEQLIRAAGAWFFATPDGQIEIIGANALGGYAELIEGRDILIGREHISSLTAPSNKAGGQKGGSDDEWGAKIAHGLHADGEGGGGDMATKMFQRVLSEIPAQSVDQLKNRARIEDNVGDQLRINVWLTVLGWQRPSGGLWWPKDIVYVDAPMLIMQRPLVVKKVTFTQDNQSGTRTMLELVNLKALGGSKAGT
jgi:prophage tail gpP-like protein